MTPAPKTIAYDETLEQASSYMRALHVRHLPVVRGNRLIGIVSERDLNLIFTFRNQDALNIRVEQALTPNPYIAHPETPLNEVMSRMAEHKYGSVLVVEDGRLVGIFTSVDALRALAKVFLEQTLASA